MKSTFKLVAVLFVMTLTLVACRPATLEDITLVLNDGVDTIEIGDEFVDAGAKAFVFGLPYKTTVIENTVDTSTLGQYKIVYEYTRNDLVKTIERYVFVIDETAPVITLNAGVDTVMIGQTWVDASVTVSDNDPTSIIVTTEEAVNEAVEGTYDVIYTATDQSGNTAQIIRKVHVINP